MKIQIGYTEATYTLTLYNMVQSWDLGEARQVNVDSSENGTIWFDIRGRKKPIYSFSYQELETASETSDFKVIQEMSIPDYLLPVWVKIEDANITNQYTVQTEYEGIAYIHLVKKTVNTVPTIRDFDIVIYTQ